MICPRGFTALMLVTAATAVLARPARADFAATVPGTSNPWLAGLPDGSTAASGDVAPTHSPVLVSGLTLTGGTVLRFRTTGSVNNSPSPGFAGPDGSGFISHGSENGIAALSAPINSLLGVFLDATLPTATAAPAGLDFAPGGGIAGGVDYLSVSPQLKQVFFIGDGVTASLTAQSVVAPAGATRLYLGTMDGTGWFNNSGSFEVVVTADTVSAVPGPSTLVLLAGGLALLGRISSNAGRRSVAKPGA